MHPCPTIVADWFRGPKPREARYSTSKVSPNVLGDLLLPGVSQAVVNNAASARLQAEVVYALDAAYKLRAGLFVTARRDASDASYLALPVGPTCGS